MKRALLLCSVCFLMLGSSYAQTQTEGKTSITNPVLKEQVEKIQAKENQITNAATSSRAVVAQLVEEKNALLKEYSTLLANEIAVSADPAQKASLQEELTRVNALISTNTKR